MDSDDASDGEATSVRPGTKAKPSHASHVVSTTDQRNKSSATSSSMPAGPSSVKRRKKDPTGGADGEEGEADKAHIAAMQHTAKR